MYSRKNVSFGEAPLLKGPVTFWQKELIAVGHSVYDSEQYELIYVYLCLSTNMPLLFRKLFFFILVVFWKKNKNSQQFISNSSREINIFPKGLTADLNL